MNNQEKYKNKGYRYIDGVEQPKQKSGSIGHAGFAVGRFPDSSPKKAPMQVKKASLRFKKGGSVTARGQGAVMKKRPTKNC
jgi:hypothetical protein